MTIKKEHRGMTSLTGGGGHVREDGCMGWGGR